MAKLKIPELLAPVGGWQQLKAAVQNGADAVYMGGPLFNARIKAENFTHEDMRKAICYAHDRNVRVYVTINTLIKDSELERAFSYVNFLYGAGADAVILQDIGLSRLIRKYLPDMNMHLSTQGTVYNRWAVESAKRLGFCRLVPARELTLTEIEAFAEECHKGESLCETEVFVHGALCMCYSGQCHMSRVIGGINGRSGNRGLCAQPCRLSYRDRSGEERFLLSPKDICAVSLIPALCKAGVDSFKIEGRLKSPQYVAVVTSVYRKYLDMYRDTGHVQVSDDDMTRLLQIFNRGGFSRGYLEGNPGGKLLSGESPKNQGIYIGRVANFRKGSTLIDVRLDAKGARAGASKAALSMGDGVEIRGSKLTGNVISYLKPLDDGSVRIGDIKGRVSIGDKVYKVTDKKLTTEAEKSYENDFGRKVSVTMKLTAKRGRLPELTVSESRQGGRISVAARGEKIAEEAINKPLTEERAGKQLGKLGDTVFRAEKLELDIDENISVPISAINKMRREAIALLLEKRRGIYERCPLNDAEVRDICEKEKLGDETTLANNGKERTGIYVYSRETLDSFNAKAVAGGKKVSVYVPLELYMEEEARAALIERLHDKAEVIPYIINVSRGKLDEYIEDNFERIAEAVKSSGVMTGNLGWIKRLKDAGVKVYGDYGLNVYNGQSVKAFEEMGVEVRAYSHEADEYSCGDIPLMITEHPVTAETFTDRKGAAYHVMKWHSGDKYLIFASRSGSVKCDSSKRMNYVF